MPTLDAPSHVNEYRTVPRQGRWPDDVASISVEELAVLTPHGGVHRGVLVGWQNKARRIPVSGYRVCWREFNDASWNVAGIAEPDATSFEFWQPLAVGDELEFAVVPLAINCCIRRPLSSIEVTAAITIRGAEGCPPPVTGIAIDYLDEVPFVSWEQVDFPGVVAYEVRVGAATPWQATTYAVTHGTKAELRNLIDFGQIGGKSLYVFVAAVTATGMVGNFGRSDAWSPSAWGDAGAFGTAFGGAAASWAGGTHAGTVVTSGAIGLDETAGIEVGVWTSGNHDIGKVGHWRFHPLIEARRLNGLLSPALMLFSPSSIHGCSYTPGGGRSEEAFPQHSLERRHSFSPAELKVAPQDLDYIAPDTLTNVRPKDEPVLAPAEMRFAPNSKAGKTFSPAGFKSTAGTGVLVEVSYSEDTSSWSPWKRIGMCEHPSIRYVKFRVTVTQPAPGLQVLLDDLVMLFEEVSWGTRRVVGETPSGTIDSVNDSFSLANEASDADSIRLVLNGVEMIRGTTYTVDSPPDGITYVTPPDPGDWHRIDYTY